MSYTYEREVAVFEATLELSPAERRVYLERTCAGDAELFQRVQRLLELHEMNTGALGSAASGAASAARLSLPESEKTGDLIGPYKLLQQIGEGGCGVVYMAEQEAPIRRRVALKIIKLGMDTRQVIARFEAERQALALMDHPNIAKVHDAGATEAGRPYFVMELVRGLRITDYCDEKKLTTQQRLELFMQVCQAVQHAHQKGIIHRDLKPSNILVTVNGGIAIPKVIDFGIAKATNGERLTDKTIFTAFEQFIGTPAYMSPEQAELTSLDIDTRSDIYSLGVLLYELLTGQTPFDAKDLLKEGLDEMRRTLREKEPARPSNRLSTLGAHELTTAANRRGLDAPKLVNSLRGDLDWIVMKCLEKDRVRRYETAIGLASDIERHLENEPVVASPPGRLYRFGKMVRRNKVAVAVGCSLLVFLVLGLGGATWGYFQEREARQAVEALRSREHALVVQAQKVERISKAKKSFEIRRRETAEQLLNEIPPLEIEPDPDHASLRRKLGWWYAAHEEWSKSATNFAILERVDGLDGEWTMTMDRLSHGVALVQGGQIAEYQVLRQKILAEFLQTTNPIIADHVCRACLLLPADDVISKSLDKLYNVIERRQGDPTINFNEASWFGLDLALVDYRRGDFSNAVEHCHACLQARTDYIGAGLRGPTVYALLAMSNHQLHREEAAGAALAQARKDDYIDLRRLFNFGEEPVLFWGIYGQVLAREAAALIEGQTSSQERYYTIGEVCLGNYYATGRAGDRLTDNLLEGIKWYRKAIEHGSIEAQLLLAQLLATSTDQKIRDLPEAIKWYREAAEHGSKEARLPLADLLANSPDAKTRNLPEAIRWYRAAAEQDEVQAQNSLAWLLATCPDPKLRDGTNAVRFAEKAVAATNRKEAGILDTLAAAYAETGEFEKAVAAQNEAISLAMDASLKRELDSHLKLYQSGKPLRE